MAVGRVYSSGTFALELAGAPAGFLVTVAGGEAFGLVAEEKPSGGWVGKHVGGVAFADIVIEACPPLSAPLRDWITSHFEGRYASMSGAIVFLDHNMNAQERLEWTDGFISQITLPAADGASKETALVRLTITPERTRLVAGAGVAQDGPSLKQRGATKANFSFALAGLEQASAKVSKVAAISVTRTAPDDIGELRDFEKSVPALVVSSIGLTLAQSEVAPYAAWFEDFVINGNCDAAHERTGSLTFLDAGLKNRLLSVDLGGVGITRITHDRDRTRAEGVAHATIDLYCTTVTLGR